MSPVMDCIMYERNNAANVSIADIITLSDMDDIKSPTAMHDKP